MPTNFWTYIEPLDGWNIDALDGSREIAVVWADAELVALSLDPTDAYNVHRADLEPFFAQLTRGGVLPLADLDAAFGEYGPAVAALLAACPGVEIAEDGTGLRYVEM